MGAVQHNRNSICNQECSTATDNDETQLQKQRKSLQIEVNAEQLFVESTQIVGSVLDAYKLQPCCHQVDLKDEVDLQACLQNLKIHPDDSESKNKCWIIARRINVDKFEQILEKEQNALTEASQQLYLLLQGIIKCRSEMFEQAKNKYKQSLSLKKDSYEAFHQLVTVLQIEHNSEQIKATIHEFINYKWIKPMIMAICTPFMFQDNFIPRPPIYSIALIYTNIFLYSKSNAVLQRYIQTMEEIDKEEYQDYLPFVFFLIGFNFLKMGAFQKCEYWFNKIIKDKQQNIYLNIKSFLAVVYCRQGRLSEARLLVRKIERELPQNIKYQGHDMLPENLLIIYTTLRQSEMALKIYQTYKKDFTKYYQPKWVGVEIYALVAYDRLQDEQKVRKIYNKVQNAIKNYQLPINFLSTYVVYEYMDYCLAKALYLSAKQALTIAIDFVSRLSAINPNEFEFYRIKNEEYSEKIKMSSESS